MKVAIIVQARMGSTRLPGKIMKSVLGKPLLEYLLERLQRVEKSDEICVATTTKLQEQSILDVCSRMSVKTFRGSEEDVLQRYFLAAQYLKADAIVRVTSDCPLIDPAEIDKLIGCYLENLNRYDYIADGPKRSYPWGMGSEIFSFEALKQAYENAKSKPEREHVTPYIYWNPHLFRLGNLAYKEDQKDHRWTVDTPEDFELVTKIIENLCPIKPEFSIEDILNLVQENPEWKEINCHVVQKKARE
ncbi:MAG: glycosyltransferase family protein [Candidatus Omnitrophica bacterium]|nr:glycosyltransferase family protein [Candidatus Omnitrophota bacterium]